MSRTGDRAAEWCAEYVRVRDALEALVERMDAVHADPAFRRVWDVDQLREGPYRGLTYVLALERAREAVAEAEG
jgi:hypothetical protein